MKRGTVVALVALGVTLVGAGVAGQRWWEYQHTAQVQLFETPQVAQAPTLLGLKPMITGLEQPSDVVFVPGSKTQVVVLEQAGKARLLDIAGPLAGGPPVDAKTAPLVLEIWVRSMSEMGLLSMAFHPKYEENGKFYARYDPWIHNTLRSRLAEFELPKAELGKRVATEKRTLIEVDQGVPLHQGGQVMFGPDGKLYVGFGDGGTANDSERSGQNLGSVKGKILRFDVDGPNLIPEDNPFVKQAGARGEVWAYGLRNPWRFIFDKAGNAIVGDVGQEGREELDLVAAGANLGWNIREGTICGLGLTTCVGPEFVDPIFEYDRSVGSCIIGGVSATGSKVPEIAGKYIFADFVRGRIWSMDLPAKAPKAGEPWTPIEPKLLGEWAKLFAAFALDADGNAYVTDVSAGEVLAILPP